MSPALLRFVIRATADKCCDRALMTAQADDDRSDDEDEGEGEGEAQPG